MSACNAGDLGSIPGSGRYPGEGNGTSLRYSCLENVHGLRSPVGYSPWGHKESDTTEQLHFHFKCPDSVSALFSRAELMLWDQTRVPGSFFSFWYLFIWLCCILVVAKGSWLLHAGSVVGAGQVQLLSVWDPSSPSRDLTCIPCIVSGFLNHPVVHPVDHQGSPLDRLFLTLPLTLPGSFGVICLNQSCPTET